MFLLNLDGVAMYEILEVSLATLSRLYQFKQQDAFHVNFNIKGFDYPWLVTARPWKAGERVLDVGAAYSPLPVHLHKTFGCEMWAVDDFGGSEDPFWQRYTSPQAYIEQHPERRFVLERLGDPQHSSLEPGYFDVIYSASVLEHVPASAQAAVWQHMDALLKPGGEMLHAVDVVFPSNAGLKKVLLTMLYDTFYGLLPRAMRQQRVFATPKSYARWACNTLGVRAAPLGQIGVPR
jgi:hypothetical protein